MRRIHGRWRRGNHGSIEMRCLQLSPRFSQEGSGEGALVRISPLLQRTVEPVSGYGSTGSPTTPASPFPPGLLSWSLPRPSYVPSPRLQGSPAYMPVIFSPSQSMLSMSAWNNYPVIWREREQIVYCLSWFSRNKTIFVDLTKISSNVSSTCD